MPHRMTNRERILAVVQGRPLDRVPFVMYDALLPVDEVRAHLGRENIGLMRWSAVHRVEHPHCVHDSEEYHAGERKWVRNTIHTPVGSIYEERAYESAYGSSSIRKHYVEEPADYEVLWCCIEDSMVLPDYERYYQDERDMGDDGVPLVAVERSPYQQLWVQWTGLDALCAHLVDCPDRVQRTVDLLERRARRIFDVAYRSPAPFVDFPDNITAPAIGPRRFRQYCVPLYDELAGMLAERGALVFVHMDGDLKPLWHDIAASQVGGFDSLSPTPDNDTSVAEAVAQFPGRRLFVNYPSSQHLLAYDGVYARASEMLQAAGHTGCLQLQISENVPHGVWRTSFRAISAAIADFGRP